MKKLIPLLIAGVFLFSLVLNVSAQDFTRKVVQVPKVDPTTITLDGQMNEAAWETAAAANMITDTGYEIWTNKYLRESLTEPDYDEMYARMLWSQDTLFVFMHIDEFVNDTTDLYWAGKWAGDQLFISLSNRLGVDMMGWYDGNTYAVPNGPYHFWIMGDEVTLNGGEETYIPEEYRCSYGDSVKTFDAAEYARWATFIDKENGVWNVELAIYNPNVAAQGSIGFNIGGSTGSEYVQTNEGDAYAYYTWQPNVPDDPYAVPAENDPGYYNLVSSSHWAILKFEPGVDDVVVRKEVDVPEVDPSAITLDGQMNEAAWETAAAANMITDTGYEIWTNKYLRESLTEPDYDEMYARMLWSQDTLFVFMHIDEFVNDTTDLYWAGKWAGDQLFMSLSNHLGIEMNGWYDGNTYAVPDGPYHFWIMGDEVTLNGGESTYVPEEYRCTMADSFLTYDAAEYARWATFIDKENGVWNVEIAIYNPNVAAQAEIAFNIGGSTGSEYVQTNEGDAYAYYTWQPNVPDDPYAIPAEQDPGYYNLASSSHWAILNFLEQNGTGIKDNNSSQPSDFMLSQNYPNPFNPTTTIKFSVDQTTPVTLKIFNTVGQEVKTLINNQTYSAGRYRVTFDASTLTSGVYFYRLEAAGKVETRKMLFVK